MFEGGRVVETLPVGTVIRWQRFDGFTDCGRIEGVGLSDYRVRNGKGELRSVPIISHTVRVIRTAECRLMAFNAILLRELNEHVNKLWLTWKAK